jgi:hypothetical protein
VGLYLCSFMDSCCRAWTSRRGVHISISNLLSWEARVSLDVFVDLERTHILNGLPFVSETKTRWIFIWEK